MSSFSPTGLRGDTRTAYEGAGYSRSAVVKALSLEARYIVRAAQRREAYALADMATDPGAAAWWAGLAAQTWTGAVVVLLDALACAPERS